jgi:acetyl esterase/lipase
MPRSLKSLAYNATQQLDLHLADEAGRPLVVCIHGGGFIAGSRDDERCRQSAELLTGAGFNCASIGYTLAPADDRFAAWPRNLFDVADALVFLHDKAAEHGYDFARLGMLGFSAGCCLSNLYIQGGERIFDHFGYRTPVFSPIALAGFYGPYDFTTRQAERRSKDPDVNLYHSPAYWLRQNVNGTAPPVLHIQGDADDIVRPDQHAAFQQDYAQAGHSFKAVIVEGFAHAFAPQDVNPAGKKIDLGAEILAFFSRHL